MAKRSGKTARLIVLVALTLLGVAVSPAGPARAAEYANCTQLINSGYHWGQSSCVWMEGSTLYGNTGYAYHTGFNRYHVFYCKARLELWDTTTNSYVATKEYDCLGNAHVGGQHVAGRHSWNSQTAINPSHHYKQYAYMWVNTGTFYDSRDTTCALRYWPEQTGQTGC